MGEEVSPLRFILKYITDIAAIECHAGLPLLSCPLWYAIMIFKKNSLNLTRHPA
jgi:hypothetical protein